MDINKEIKISVVIPVYNVEQYLIECIESALDQDLEAFEIILVDDGSTDSSGKICDDYADRYENTRVIHKPNGGLGNARNVGIKAAVGKYIFFLDSDDSIKKNALGRLYREVKENNLDIVLFSAEILGCEGSCVTGSDYEEMMLTDSVQSGKELFLELFSRNKYDGAVTRRLYRREYLVSKSFLFPEKIVHEDELFGYMTLIHADSVECIVDKPYNRRIRPGSLSAPENYYDSATGYLYTWRKTIESVRELDGWTEKEKKKVVALANSRLNMASRSYSLMFSTNERKEFESLIVDLPMVLKNERIESMMDFESLLFIHNPHLYRYVKRTKYTLSRFVDKVIRKNE